MKVIFSVILFVVFVSDVCPARILCVFNFASTSHFILGNTYAKALAEAGHDVTMISPFEDLEPPKNGTYRNIVLTGYLDDPKKTRDKRNYFENIYRNPFRLMYIGNYIGLTLTRKTLEHPNVQNLIHSNETFDVVVIEQFFNDALKGLATHFKAHQIIISPIGTNTWVNNYVGNPTMPSFSAEFFTGYSDKMNFLQRSYNLFVTGLVKAAHYLWFKHKHNLLMKEFIPNAPDIDEVLYNASMVLMCSDSSIGPAMPSVPTMVEIGGFHIKEQTLPDDLKRWMDEAEHGVILFSFGSTIKGFHMPKEKQQIFIDTFNKLPQKVLWKYEDDVLPDRPDNVRIMKWLPQQAVLDHPNMKMYICHGGLLSITEAIYHGVPMIIMPIFADQPMNANNVQANGMGLTFDFNDLSEEKLKNAIEEILENTSYKNTVMMRAKAFQDKPMTPLQSAVYWTEYVIKHEGALHLRVHGLKLNFFQYFMIDVYLGLFLFIYLCKRIFNYFWVKRNRKLKTE